MTGSKILLPSRAMAFLSSPAEMMRHVTPTPNVEHVACLSRDDASLHHCRKIGSVPDCVISLGVVSGACRMQASDLSHAPINGYFCTCGKTALVAC